MTNPRLDERTMGERIMRHRVRAGLSRAQLSALIGRSPSWLYKVERGVLLADRLSDLANLAHILKVDPAELVGEPVPVALVQPRAPRRVGTVVASPASPGAPRDEHHTGAHAGSSLTGAPGAAARSGRRCSPARRHRHRRALLPLAVARTVPSRSCRRSHPLSSLPRCASCPPAPAPRCADRWTGPPECRTRLRIRLLSQG
jgi:hypothetical protein